MTSLIDLCREAATCVLPAGTAGKWQSSWEEASRGAREKSQVPATSGEDIVITECTVSKAWSTLNRDVFKGLLSY